MEKPSFGEWLLARLSENSTWRGLILFATAASALFGSKVSERLGQPEVQAQIVAVGLGLVGVINIFRKAPESPDAKP